MGQRCDCGMATPSLTWCPVFLLEVGSISSLSLLLGISSKVPPFESWESFTSQVSGTLWGCLFPFFLLALRASVVFPHPIPDHVPLSPPPTPSTLLPGPSLPPHLWFLFSLSQVGLRCPHLGTSACWAFWILWTIPCVFCIFFFLFFFLFCG